MERASQNLTCLSFSISSKGEINIGGDEELALALNIDVGLKLKRKEAMSTTVENSEVNKKQKTNLPDSTSHHPGHYGMFNIGSYTKQKKVGKKKEGAGKFLPPPQQ